MLFLKANSPRKDPEAALPTAKSTPTSPPSGMLALKLMVRTSALQELKPMVLLVANSPRRVPMTFLQILTQLTFLQNLSLLSSPRKDPEAALPTAKSTPTSPPSLMLALKLMVRMSALLQLKLMLLRPSPRRDLEAAPALPT